jgi:rhodanese-related sulfurtransferase
MIMHSELHPTIIDVRSSYEFLEGNIPGSINIPLLSIPKKIAEIMQLPKPIVIYSSNGKESSHASNFLKNLGIDCLNGGSWKDYKNKVLID